MKLRITNGSCQVTDLAHNPHETQSRAMGGCNGPTYAWRIAQYLHDGPYLYVLEDNGQQIEGTDMSCPYYEYMYRSFYESNIKYSQQACDHYAIDIYSVPHSHFIMNEFGYSKVFYANTPGEPNPPTQYKDRDGIILNPNLDEIVAVQKTRGVWNSSVYQTGEVLENWLGYNGEYIVQLFNQYAPVGNNPVECISNDGVVGEDDDDDDWDDVCYEAYIEEEGFDSFFDCVVNHMMVNVEYVFMEFSSWNGSYGLVNTFTEEDIYDSNGNLNEVEVTLDKGIHSLRIVGTDGKMGVVFFEVKEGGTFTLPMSGFLDINIYPVPLVSNQFTVGLSSHANISVIYEIYDMQSNCYHREIFDMHKDEEDDFVINADTPLPSGILINRWTFSDGSVKTIQTVKQ